MKAPAHPKRIVFLIGLGVALPALALAVLGVFLTLRISDAVESQSARYNYYMAQQVVETFEQDLLAHLRDAVAPAEAAARGGADPTTLRAALASGTQEFRDPEFVPLARLGDYMLLIVESQPMVYGQEVREAGGQRFAGLMLRDASGEIIGSGGWWIDPRDFLSSHLRPVMEERLPSNTRIYGGIESTRYLSVTLLGPGGDRIGRMREPGLHRLSGTVPMDGPFVGYTVRVAPTPNAPVGWAWRFVQLQLAFILLMGVVILGATVLGLRHTVRQLELARIKSSFVSNVSHELKTPISLIRLAVETLELRRFTTPEESEKFVRLIRRETMRLNQLVDNILDFARLEAGRRVYRFADIDVVGVVRDTLDSFRLRLEDQGFALTTDLPDTLPAVRGDGPAIAQCLLNLLDNAIKYSRAHREIHVAAAGRDGNVTIAVRDRGLGIAPRDQKRIFEKFLRLDTGLVHDVKGAGLGLSLVDQIVRAHGGRVEVTSAPGEGSTFTLVLPAVGAVRPPRAEPQARTAS